MTEFLQDFKIQLRCLSSNLLRPFACETAPAQARAMELAKAEAKGDGQPPTGITLPPFTLQGSLASAGQRFERDTGYVWPSSEVSPLKWPLKLH